jgi:hypothetical protein
LSTNHNGYVESEFGGTWWKAMCSCGFEGEELASEEAATAALKAHYEASA